MKRTAIILLVCVNVALLGMLVTRAMSRAEAQVRGRPAAAMPSPPPNYLLLTGLAGSDRPGEVGADVVYVLDVNTGKLLAWEFDHKTKRLKIIRLGRDLIKDFSAR